MINEQNPQIEVAHTREEMLHILESLRLEACQIEDIYVIAKDPSKFDGVKWDANVKTHEVGNWVDQIKSWFTGESAVKEGFKRFDLTEGQTAYYAHLVEQGVIVLFAEQSAEPMTT
ncbi:general stress protein [Lysinibacillus sp. NPDC095746]|uniref:general stress protein n=1 Tax=unclassified Lysinibacillus TaxID=2636778 RepID=UPI001051A165|nr:general stress protein [Lysinibacillus sp. CNPSo 3705]MDD1502498.1 general stress protein [Lysinibacillus sp. CNPSo 3705]